MGRYGLTRESETGTVYHPSGAMSVKIQIVRPSEASERLRCSLVYEVHGGEVAAAGLERIATRLGEDAWNRREETTADGKEMTIWSIMIHGRQGELFHILPGDGRRPGVMAIQFSTGRQAA